MMIFIVLGFLKNFTDCLFIWLILLFWLIIFFCKLSDSHLVFCTFVARIVIFFICFAADFPLFGKFNLVCCFAIWFKNNLLWSFWWIPTLKLKLFPIIERIVFEAEIYLFHIGQKRSLFCAPLYFLILFRMSILGVCCILEQHLNAACLLPKSLEVFLHRIFGWKNIFLFKVLSIIILKMKAISVTACFMKRISFI